MCNQPPITTRWTVATCLLALLLGGCDRSDSQPQVNPPTPVNPTPTTTENGMPSGQEVPTPIPTETTQPAPAEPPSPASAATAVGVPPEIDTSLIEKVPAQAADFMLTYDEWDAIRSDGNHLAENRQKYTGKWIAIQGLVYGTETNLVRIGKSEVGPEFAVHTNIRRPWLVLPLWSRITLIAQADFEGEPRSPVRLRHATWTIQKSPQPAASYDVASFLDQTRRDPKGFPGERLFAVHLARVSVYGKLVKAYWFRRDYGEIILSNEAGDQQVSFNIMGDRVAEAMRLQPGEMCRVLLNCRFSASDPPPAMSEHTIDGYLMSPVRSAGLANDTRLQTREVRDVREKETTSSIDLSADGNQLLVIRTSYDSSRWSADVWDTRDNTKIADLKLEGRKIVAGRLLSGGQEVLLEGYNDDGSELYRVKIASGEVLESWPGTLPEKSGGLSPDRTRLVSSDEDNITIREIATGKETRIADHGLADIQTIVLSPDNQMVAAVDGDGLKVKIWNLTTGTLVKELEPKKEPESRYVHLAFSNDGSRFAVAHYGTLNLFDAKTFEKLSEHNGDAYKFSKGVGFSSDFKKIVTTSEDEISCSDIESGELEIFFYGKKMAIDGAGTTIVTDFEDGVFRFLPITAWKQFTY